jgi:hypothetical protein
MRSHCVFVRCKAEMCRSDRSLDSAARVECNSHLKQIESRRRLGEDFIPFRGDTDL